MSGVAFLSKQNPPSAVSCKYKKQKMDRLRFFLATILFAILLNCQNAPNPSVTGTQIRYEVAQSARVRIKIYDALGRHVTTLVDGVKGPGVHSARWDGRNSKGKPVTSGVYFYKMEAGNFAATRKMLALR